MAAGDGLISMTPTSASGSGTSPVVTINGDGGVDWVGVNQLTIDGVFTSELDNYLIVFDYQHSYSANVNLLYRMIQNGALDNTSTYTNQMLSSDTAAITRLSLNYGWLGYSSPISNGVDIHIYGPNLAQPTALRSVTVGARLSSYPQIADWASTVNSSTQYTGLRFYTNYSDSGSVHVFGYEE